MEPCCEQDIPSCEYMLKREPDGEDVVLKEMGIDLEGDETGDVSKCMLIVASSVVYV